MADYWVCKPDGTIQCQDVVGTSLDAMRKLLASIVGDENIVGQAKKSGIAITMCGAATGALNAYQLTQDGYDILRFGIWGREGFNDCRNHPAQVTTTSDALDLGTLLATTRVTSATMNPILVRELIGHVVRVYEEGSPITKDFQEGRVNIVTLDKVIADIWFG